MDKADHHSGSDWFYTREVTQQMQIHQEKLVSVTYIIIQMQGRWPRVWKS